MASDPFSLGEFGEKRERNSSKLQRTLKVKLRLWLCWCQRSKTVSSLLTLKVKNWILLAWVYLACSYGDFDFQMKLHSSNSVEPKHGSQNIYKFSVSSKRSMLCNVAQSFDIVQSIIIFQYHTINYRSIRESEESHSSPIFIKFLLISSRKTFIFNLVLFLCFGSVLPLDSAFAMYLPSTLLFTVGLGHRSLVDSLIRPETSLIFHRALPIPLQIRQQTPKAFVESWVYIFTILQLFSLFAMETSGERCDILLRAKLVPND